MKSKLDIIKENYEKVFSSSGYDTSVNKEMNKSYILPAMDEYAEIIAIDFAKWIESDIKNKGTYFIKEMINGKM